MIQRHPIDSFDPKRNFWEEFPDYKIHRLFGRIHALNKKEGNLQNSSNFMWVLSLCYDRKSSLFTQPEHDKWEVACEQLFNDESVMIKISEDHLAQDFVHLPKEIDLFEVISEFESSIDTPLGISLRTLEKKLAERTKFIQETPYTMDEYQTKGKREVLVRGTATQLDKMFADTDKITALIQKAMDNLRAASAETQTKGGQKESLGDGAQDF